MCCLVVVAVEMLSMSHDTAEKRALVHPIALHQGLNSHAELCVSIGDVS